MFVKKTQVNASLQNQNLRTDLRSGWPNGFASRKLRRNFPRTYKWLAINLCRLTLDGQRLRWGDFTDIKVSCLSTTFVSRFFKWHLYLGRYSGSSKLGNLISAVAGRFRTKKQLKEVTSVHSYNNTLHSLQLMEWPQTTQLLGWPVGYVSYLAAWQFEYLAM